MLSFTAMTAPLSADTKNIKSACPKVELKIESKTDETTDNIQIDELQSVEPKSNGIKSQIETPVKSSPKTKDVSQFYCFKITHEISHEF